MFSLGVITYQMLTGKLPYGAQIAKARTKSQLSKLRYRLRRSTTIARFRRGSTARSEGRASRSHKRYESLSEFTFDLRHPNAKYLDVRAAADRAQPVCCSGNARRRFWRCMRRGSLLAGTARIHGERARAARIRMYAARSWRQASSRHAAIIGFGAAPCRASSGIRRSSVPGRRLTGLPSGITRIGALSRSWRSARPSPRTPRRSRDTCRPR